MTRTKEWGALVALLLLVAVSLAACGGDDEDDGGGAPETAPAEEPATETSAEGEASDIEKIPRFEGKRIAYIQTGDVEYFDSSMRGARAAVEALGGEFLVFNSNYDAATELDNVRTAIAQSADGILLFSVSRGALESSARLINDADIPVANYYGYVEDIDPELMDFWTGANPFDIGTLDGQAMAELLDEGDTVATVQGQLGRGEVEAYQEGFRQEIAKKNITIVAEPTSHWSRQEAFEHAQDILVRYPDVDGMFCHNDDTTVGCVQALRQAGRQPGEVNMVTLNGSPTGIELMEEGWLQANVTQPPPLESALAVRALAQIIGGVEIDYPVPCHTPISLITEEDLEGLDPLISWTPTMTEQALVTPCANQTGDIFGP